MENLMFIFVDKYPVFLKFILKRFNRKEIDTDEKQLVLDEFNDIICKYGDHSMIQELISICGNEDIEFNQRYDLSVLLESYDKFLLNDTFNETSYDDNIFLSKSEDTHESYVYILSNHNPYMRRYESFAYRTFRRLIKSDEPNCSLLAIILEYKHHLFFYKYFHHLSSNFVKDVFQAMVNSYSDNQMGSRILNSLFSFLVMLEKRDLLKKFLLSIMCEHDDGWKRRYGPKVALMLLRINTSLDSSSAIDDEAQSLLGQCRDFEMKFLQNLRLSTLNNETLNGLISTIKALQHIKSPSTVFYILKNISRVHQLSPDFDAHFSLSLSLYHVQYSKKQFGEGSYPFVRAVAALTLMLLELNISAKYMAEKLVGLCEMLYYSPSKSLSSANLILSKSQSLECHLLQRMATENEDLVISEYAAKAHEVSLSSSHEISTLKSILWLLQLVDKFSAEGYVSPEYARYFCQACVIIDSLGSSDASKHLFYRAQLELVDSLQSCLQQRCVTPLSPRLLAIVTHRHNIHKEDSLVDRRLKIVARCSPLVRSLVRGSLLESATDDRGAPWEVTYKRLLKRPEEEFLFAHKLWLKKEPLKADQGDTEDSESDSLSDGSSAEL